MARKEKRTGEEKMSYWAAYYGDALVLNEKEFYDFCDRYRAVKNIDENEDLFEETTIREYPFESGSDPNDIFEVTDILIDECDGMRLMPFLHEGKENIYIWGENGLERSVHTKSMRCDNCYAIFAKKNRFGVKAIGQPPYASYEELKAEFQSRLAAYLPEDFSWDLHIGILDYACYA